MSDELKIKVSAIADGRKLENSIKTVTSKFTGDSAPKIEVSVSKINASKAIKQWKSIFQDSVKDITAPNIDLKPLNSQYKNLEKQADAFHKKNLNGIDLEIKKRELASSRFSSQLKSQMEQAEKAKNATNQINKISNSVVNSGKYDKDVFNAKTNILKYNQLGFDTSLAQKSLKDVKTAKLEYDKAMASGDVKRANQATNELNTALNKVKNSLSQISTESSKDKSINDKTKALQNLRLEMQNYIKANDKLKNNSKAIGSFNNIYKDVNNALKSGDVSGADRLIGKFKNLQSEMKEAGIEGQRFGTKLRQQFEKLSVYFSASAIMLGSVVQIKNMIKNVIELDRAMTELKKVTNETDETYVRFLENAETRAKNIGATLTDTVRATAEFAKLGYGIPDAEKLSDASIIYKNVADGVNDIGESSGTIIATMKANDCLYVQKCA